ncbi:MAG TPA: RNA polymerase sigma factor RpoE [Gammaproteobacteria bacterium]|nr:RNA polymerase sigma factor RpoE [Gammaproteobacteria bacterium]
MTEKKGAHASSGNSDAELVKLVKSGEKYAFDLLVQKYQNKIIHLVGRYVKDPSAAQDVAQDAFIKAYRGLGNFRGDSAFYTWLYRIAINTAKNHLVAINRRSPNMEIDAAEAEQFGEYEPLKDNATPERVALSEEIKVLVMGTIESLPDDLKTAITLREVEGMSYEAIAETMDCPIGTVRSRIFRAREAIDRVLQPLLG